MGATGRRAIRESRVAGWWVATAILVLSITLVLGPQSVPSAASPAPNPPAGLQASHRSRMAILSWEQPGAQRWQIEYAETFTFSGTRTQSAERTIAILTGLEPETRYYARVRAVLADGELGETSRVLSFVTEPESYPAAPPQVTVRTDGESRTLAVDWDTIPQATSYVVAASLSEDMSEARTLTVEKDSAVIDELERRTTYYVHVRGLGADGEPVSDWSSVERATTEDFEPLRVGSYNILKVRGGTSKAAPWSKRRTALAQTIRDADMDVVGLQEATPARYKGRRQFNDMVAALGSGWAITDADGHTTGEVRTVYNTERVTLLGHGYRKVAGSEFGVPRYVTWDLFEQKSTDKRFIFVNTHNAYQNGKKADNARAKATRQLVQLVEEVNTDDLPVIIVGDFNSGKYRTSSNAVYRTITGAGYIDPLVDSKGLGEAETKIRANLKTVNGYRRKAPVDSWARMIDHIFVSEMRVSEWETVARLNKSGRFIGTIPSDHNMIRATVYLP